MQDTDLILANTLSIKDACTELLEAGIFTPQLADETFKDILNNPELFYKDLDKFRFNGNTAGLIRKYWLALSDADYISLTDIAREHDTKNPSYIIQSWLRSRNTVEFLRVWEKENNPLFLDSAYEKLLQLSTKPSFTLTPKQWISKTASIGLVSKQGKNGGTSAHPDIATDFQMWLEPALRLNLIQIVRSFGGKSYTNK